MMGSVSTLKVKVHAIATAGLPDMEKLTGRVAFIFDGCIVSGWPLIPAEGQSDEVRFYHDAGKTLWEADSDVGTHRPLAGVTHWIEFPEPIWQIATVHDG